MIRKTLCQSIFVLSCWIALQISSFAAPPTTSAALRLKPVQPGVMIENPAADELEKCTIKVEETAWVVRGPTGNILRKFADADADNVVDTWSYYRNGLEIYRDIDADHNGKADQYRWFHNAGMRWGLDLNEDGKIDTWKLISPEEVAEEVFEAVRTTDEARFRALLLSAKEIGALGLSKVESERIAKRAVKAIAAFQKLVKAGTLTEESEFSDFGGLKPGMVPAGTQGSKKDVMVYESVWAMISGGEQHQQMRLGSMVNVGGGWKLVDGPTIGNTESVASGIFFNPEGGASLPPQEAMASPPTEKMQELLAQLEKLDQQITGVVPAKQTALNKRRANLLLQLSSLMPKQSEREQWLRQLADMVSAAFQEGSFEGGIDYLKELEGKLAKQVENGGLSEDVVVYLKFHRMIAEYYGVTLADEKVDYAKAQAEWLKDLEAFVDEYPHSESGAEILRQLAMGTEMNGDSEAAVKWYSRIVKSHAESPAAKLAKGAMLRLTSEGKLISLKGPTVGGGEFNLEQHRGKVVAIQYWTTSSEVQISDHAILKDLYAKYGGRGLEIVGVNLDYVNNDLAAYLKANKLPWKQLYEKGGFESRLAIEMGIVTVPMILLVDPVGKVVSNNIQAAEIEAELKKLLPAKNAKKLLPAKNANK